MGTSPVGPVLSFGPPTRTTSDVKFRLTVCLLLASLATTAAFGQSIAPRPLDANANTTVLPLWNGQSG